LIISASGTDALDGQDGGHGAHARSIPGIE